MPRGPSWGASIRRVIGRLAEAWEVPTLAGVPMAVNPHLRRTLGRVLRQPPAIQLNPAVLDSPRRTEVIAHEAAHAALVLNGKANATRPHGPEWQRLMALAGFPSARATHARACLPKPRPQARTRYLHRCPVCHTTRTAKRRVPEWRCAACVATGLEGRLVIHRAAPRA